MDVKVMTKEMYIEQRTLLNEQLDATNDWNTKKKILLKLESLEFVWFVYSTMTKEMIMLS